MTVDYATLLANAQTALNNLLSGAAVVEWSEGGHRVRITEPTALLAIIERLESLAAEQAGGTCFRPIVTVNP